MQPPPPPRRLVKRYPGGTGNIPLDCNFSISDSEDEREVRGREIAQKILRPTPARSKNGGKDEAPSTSTAASSASANNNNSSRSRSSRLCSPEVNEEYEVVQLKPVWDSDSEETLSVTSNTSKSRRDRRE